MTIGLNSALRLLSAALSCAGLLATARGDSQLTPARGLFDHPLEIVLHTDVPGSTILFTTNGGPVTIESGISNKTSIEISTSTILHAAVYKNGKQIGAEETHTYIFPETVAKQTGSGFPSHWGTNNGKPVIADYEMDPEIAVDSHYKESLALGLRAIPAASLVLKNDDLFDSERGIYANPEKSGAEWERPASFEWIDSQTHSNFQINCGVRVQGGWNRRPEESPKHALRILFKKKYGKGKLRYPLFGSSGPEEFDTLVLRAGCNNSWLHWSGRERARAEYVRDQWMRDTLRELGQPSAAGTFVHLYLNGLYWGIYNLTERPDAAFAAEHLGGSARNYDAMNAEKSIQGDKAAWNNLMRLVNAGVKEPSAFHSVTDQLDLDNFIDYMIANFYGANSDWDRSSNWYAARRRTPAGKFRFFVWDGERTLEGIHDTTLDFDDDESPPRIFHKLSENAEFRKLFSEHVHRDFFGNGALTAENNARRYRKWSDQLDTAIIAESARWGDYRRDVHPYKEGPYELYTRDHHWKPEVERILNEYFPARGPVVLEQFRSRGLYSE
jgi:hypothetical protein